VAEEDGSVARGTRLYPRNRFEQRVRIKAIADEKAVSPLVDDRRVDVRGSAACYCADRDLCEDPSLELGDLADLDRGCVEDPTPRSYWSMTSSAVWSLPPPGRT
jgi:hypothetical protein